jgi:branched-chain amino acid transport system ATP-binding protein
VIVVSTQGTNAVLGGGLAPKVASRIFDVVGQVKGSETAVLLVEQNLNQVLAVADRGYVPETGRIVLAGTCGDLRQNDNVRSASLGL